MKQTRFRSVCKTLAPLILLVLLGAGRTRRGEVEIPDISRRVNQFTFDLLRQQATVEDAPANILLSPQSIFHGMAMSYVASGGDTREELRQAFHFPANDKALLKDLARLRRQMLATDRRQGITLALANSIWLDDTYAHFRKEYVQLLSGTFDAPLHRLDFKRKNRASDLINQWISEQTHGRIPQSVAAEDFPSRSRPGAIEEPCLVTADAVYFKAVWGTRFDKASTRMRPFYVDRTTAVQTPMMEQQSVLVYSENEGLQFLEIPYLDDLYSMYVVLPKTVLSVPELMQRVTMQDVIALRQRAIDQSVDLFFPKFEMRSRLRVKRALTSMGVRAAFSSQNADFDKMIHKTPEAFRVYISEIHHDAWIGVDEEGTEMAAATTHTHFSFGCGAPRQPQWVEFQVDRPFLFLVVHNQSRSILFAGWISHPERLAAAEPEAPRANPTR